MSRTTTFDEVMQKLNDLANPENVAGQQRFGIRGGNMLGISLYDLRKLAQGIRDHDLAQQLWASGIHDARVLASMVDDPHQVTAVQMNAWVKDFDSWDICDQATDNLFIHTKGILELIPQWAAREEEFVRRAAFATIAAIAWHGHDIPDSVIAEFFPLIKTYSNDPRNFVKKAVNWALRNIGKRRNGLRREAIACAQDLLKSESASARWIAKDALKEFQTKFGEIE